MPQQNINCVCSKLVKSIGIRSLDPDLLLAVLL